MSTGSADLRLIQSRQHDAIDPEEMSKLVEAYGLLVPASGCAACQFYLDFDYVRLAYQHSVRFEPGFCDPFQAQLKAFCLRSQILVDHWHSGLYDQGQGCLPVRNLRSLVPKSRTPRKLSFDPIISLCLCSSDADEFIHCRIRHDQLKSWKSKPWTLRTNTSKITCDSRLACQPLVMLLPAWVHTDSILFSSTLSNIVWTPDNRKSSWQAHSQVSAPLSSLAVSSFPRETDPECDFEGLPLVDLVSFMQSNVPTASCKNDPHEEGRATLLAAFTHGNGIGDLPAEPVADPPDSDRSGSSDVQGVQTTSSDSTNSDVVLRQDVLLFHLDDEPIRAMLHWSDYEAMMTEIAHHFAVERPALIDAYEVASLLPNLDAGVVPIVVHLAHDIPPQYLARLVLVDWEYHGHRVEDHHQLGPSVDRSVSLVPAQVTRDGLLRAAEVDRYCNMEGDRCMVYHNGRYWLDTDVQDRVVAHADYVRIVLPPSESFACPTVSIVHMRQTGMTEDNIVDAIHNDDALSGYSPSLLSEDEVRNLATRNVEVDNDMLSVLQLVGSPAHLHIVSKQAQAAETTRHARSRGILRSAECTIQPPQDSFTEEFLHAVRVASDAVEDAPEFPNNEPPLVTQSEFVQELWDLWTAHATLGPGEVELLGRVETWYTDHHRHLRCMSPRLVILPREYSTWERLILQEWRDVRLLDSDTHFHLVYPTPEDRAPGVFAQIVIVQQPREITKSLVISVYDSDREVQRPFSFCQVLPARLGIDEVLDVTGLTEVCSSESPQNECSLWYGTTLIRTRVFVRSGYALRLSVRRGIAIEMPTLLQMPDHILRHQLHNAIWGVLYRRPSWPAFSGDANAMPAISHWDRAVPLDHSLPTTPRSPPATQADNLPPWLVALRRIFDHHARIEDPEEGPIIEVFSWFLHGRDAETCTVPKSARLDSTQFMWRSTILFPWLDSVQRAQPIEFQIVDPTPPSEPWQTPVAHVILSQMVHRDLRVALVSSDQFSATLGRCQRATILPRQVSHVDLRTALPLAGSFARIDVHRGSEILDDTQTVAVSHGDCFVLHCHDVETVAPAVIDTPDAPSTDEVPDPADDLMLLQLHRMLGPGKAPAVLSTSVCAPSDAQPAEFSFDQAIHSVGCVKSKVTISLDACIALPQTYCADGFVGTELTYWTREDWPKYLAQAKVEFAPLPEGLNVTAETFHALATPADYAELPLANNLAFYVDGSVSGSQAAWSVVAVHYDFHGIPALQGCLSGSVVVNSAAPDWIGATTTDNITAELTAAIAAMIAALCQESTMQIVIRPDLRLSAMLASLQGGTPKL